MKNHIYALMFALLVIAFSNNKVIAQSEIDTTVSLDILTVPNSPAFNLLEISPAGVEAPNE